MSTPTSDVIDLLAGIEPGSPLHDVRARREQARDNAQKSYRALFESDFPEGFSALERHAVATFVAGLHRQPVVAGFYEAALRRFGQPRIVDAIGAEISRGAAQGPYGRYPQGPLSVEDKEGPDYRVSAASAADLGPKLTAAFEHAHLLVFHPRDASSAALQRLLDAGWSTTDIVTLSQLVSFLAFQIRVIAGLRTLAATSGHEAIEPSHTPVFTGLLASGTL
jgi:CMD domain protein